MTIVFYNMSHFRHFLRRGFAQLGLTQDSTSLKEALTPFMCETKTKGSATSTSRLQQIGLGGLRRGEEGLQSSGG